MKKILIKCKFCGHAGQIDKPKKNLVSLVCLECGERFERNISEFVEIDEKTTELRCKNCGVAMPKGRTIEYCSACSNKKKSRRLENDTFVPLGKFQ